MCRTLLAHALCVHSEELEAANVPATWADPVRAQVHLHEEPVTLPVVPLLVDAGGEALGGGAGVGAGAGARVGLTAWAPKGSVDTQEVG